MKIDWLALSKSLSARIEGRNTSITVLLAFCSLALWQILATYKEHPLLSWIFGGIIICFAGFIGIAALVLKPQPSEVTTRWLVQQVGQQIISAGGLQSFEELRVLLRHAHNIHDLPAPAGIVKGSAANPADYRDLSSEEAEAMAHNDHVQVENLLRAEAVRIAASVAGRQVSTSLPPDLKAQSAMERQSAKGEISGQADPAKTT